MPFKSNILALFFLALFFACVISASAEEQVSTTVNYSDARVFNNSGVDFVSQQKYQEASKEFEKALAVDSNFHAAKYNLALAHYNMGNVKQAIDEFKNLINSSYYFVNAHYNLGTIYLRENMTDEATEQLKVVTELEPNHPEAHFNLGYIYFKKNMLDEALGEYSKGIEIKPDNVKGHLSLAFIYEKKGLYKEALGEYSYVLRLEPDNQDAKQAQGGLQAVSRINEFLNSNPKDADSFVFLGHIYYARGMYQEAYDSYNKALEINPKNKSAKVSAEKSAVQLCQKSQ